MKPRLAAFPKCYMDELCVHHTMTLLEWIELASKLDVDGLAPNSRHVFHIHEHSDTSGADLLTAGKQWRPPVATGAESRPTTTLGILEADAAGHAHFVGEIAGLGVTATDRPSVLDHAVVVHADGPPKAGTRVAGGAIRVELK